MNPFMILPMPTSERQSLSSVHRNATLVERDDVHRCEVETFISKVYAARYGATLTQFLPHLLAFRDDAGATRAAVGLRCGLEGPLFVEQYLDIPADQAIAAQTGQPVHRRDIVEAGNFGALFAGDARELIVSMTQCLHLAGFRWVLFTATRQLRNTFDRLHLATVALAPAQASRLSSTNTDWGSYYDTQPTLMFGDIAAGYAYLSDIGYLTERRWPARCGDSQVAFAGASL